MSENKKQDYPLIDEAAKKAGEIEELRKSVEKTIRESPTSGSIDEMVRQVMQKQNEIAALVRKAEEAIDPIAVELKLWAALVTQDVNVVMLAKLNVSVAKTLAEIEQLAKSCVETVKFISAINTRVISQVALYDLTKIVNKRVEKITGALRKANELISNIKNEIEQARSITPPVPDLEKQLDLAEKKIEEMEAIRKSAGHEAKRIINAAKKALEKAQKSGSPGSGRTDDAPRTPDQDSSRPKTSIPHSRAFDMVSKGITLLDKSPYTRLISEIIIRAEAKWGPLDGKLMEKLIINPLMGPGDSELKVLYEEKELEELWTESGLSQNNIHTLAQARFDAHKGDPNDKPSIESYESDVAQEILHAKYPLDANGRTSEKKRNLDKALILKTLEIAARRKESAAETPFLIMIKKELQRRIKSLNDASRIKTRFRNEVITDFKFISTLDTVLDRHFGTDCILLIETLSGKRFYIMVDFTFRPSKISSNRDRIVINLNFPTGDQENALLTEAETDAIIIAENGLVSAKEIGDVKKRSEIDGYDNQLKILVSEIVTCFIKDLEDAPDKVRSLPEKEAAKVA